MERRVAHTARVVSVGDGWVEVELTVGDACSSCRVREACGMGEGAVKRTRVETPLAGYFSEGEEVTLSISRSLSVRAVAYAYIFPFLIMFCTLIGLLEAGAGEVVAGSSSLGVAALYYLLLFLLRDRLERIVVFGVEKRTWES